MKLKFSINDHVTVTLPGNGRHNTKFFGTVRKIEITEKVTYYVQFHPDLQWVLYEEHQLSPVLIITDPPQAAEAVDLRSEKHQ